MVLSPSDQERVDNLPDSDVVKPVVEGLGGRADGGLFGDGVVLGRRLARLRFCTAVLAVGTAFNLLAASVFIATVESGDHFIRFSTGLLVAVAPYG